MERKLASIQEINGVYPIEGADRICQYGILGWKVVDQVGKYKVGDKVVYFEIDSWIPHSVAPFLTKPENFPKVYNGVEGQKLRTIRLRKSLSQGLIMPLEPTLTCSMILSELFVGSDATHPLGIQKWEPPEEYVSANTRGSFPAFIYKTDQERIQNCYREMSDLFDKVTWTVAEKIEGQSLTAYFYNGEFGVCSRNLELKDSDNTFWNTARKYNLQEKLAKLGRNIAIQGEQCGPGISGNIYGMKEYYLYVFDIFDIDTQSYLEPKAKRELIKELELTEVPIFETECSLSGMTLEMLLDKANGKSVLGFTNTLREGLVYMANTKERTSFKTISNDYLIKQKD